MHLYDLIAAKNPYVGGQQLQHGSPKATHKWHWAVMLQNGAPIITNNYDY